MTSPSAASPAASAPRLLWIDLLRGFLMLAIIFDHTEICFTGDNIVPYRMYVPDVLMAFFFLSGYLFYRPEGFRLRHKLHSWLRGVLMPYFIFTSALALPKAWLHGDGGSISDLLLTILTGQGSWFIASLAVAELLFCLLLWLSRARWRWLAGAGLFAVALAYGFGTRRLAFEANWWHVNEAVVALPSLLLGYMVHRFDSLGTRWRLGLFALLLVLSLPVNVLVASSSWPSVLVGALVLPRLFLVKNALSVLLLYLLFTISQRDGVRSRCLAGLPRWCPGQDADPSSIISSVVAFPQPLPPSFPASATPTVVAMPKSWWSFFLIFFSSPSSHGPSIATYRGPQAAGSRTDKHGNVRNLMPPSSKEAQWTREKMKNQGEAQ